MNDAEQRGCRIQSNSILDVLKFVSPTLKPVNSPPTDPRLRARSSRLLSGERKVHGDQDCIQGKQVARKILQKRNSDETVTSATQHAVEHKKDKPAAKASEEKINCGKAVNFENNNADSPTMEMESQKESQQPNETNHIHSKKYLEIKSNKNNDKIKQADRHEEYSTKNENNFQEAHKDLVHNACREKITENAGTLKSQERATVKNNVGQIAEKTKLATEMTSSSTQRRTLASERVNSTAKSSTFVKTKNSKSSSGNKKYNIQDNLQSSSNSGSEGNNKKMLTQDDKTYVPERRHCNSQKEKVAPKNVQLYSESNDFKNGNGKTPSSAKVANTKLQDSKNKGKATPGGSKPKSVAVNGLDKEKMKVSVTAASTKHSHEDSVQKQQSIKQNNKARNISTNSSKADKVSLSKISSESTFKNCADHNGRKMDQRKDHTLTRSDD